MTVRIRHTGRTRLRLVQMTNDKFQMTDWPDCSAFVICVLSFARASGEYVLCGEFCLLR
jgi:hypothetical protein